MVHYCYVTRLHKIRSDIETKKEKEKNNAGIYTGDRGIRDSAIAAAAVFIPLGGSPPTIKSDRLRCTRAERFHNG